MCNLSIKNYLQNKETHEQLKSKNNNILQAIKKSYKNKSIQLNFTKIKSHSEDLFNNITDILVKESAYKVCNIELNIINNNNVQYISE